MRTIYKVCPMCDEEYGLELTRRESSKYDAYTRGEGYIQTMLPGLNPVEREFLKTGYCPTCQGLLFGNAETDRIRKAR